MSLADRVLLVAVYWRTNLTLRQVGPLFGISHAAAHRVVDTLGPLLALQPIRRRDPEQVCIVDGTLVPLRDRSLAAGSKKPVGAALLIQREPGGLGGELRIARVLELEREPTTSL